MADKLIPSPYDTSAVVRYKDMGDGTWAPIGATAATTGAAGYPSGATPVANSSANLAATAGAATLPAAVGKTTYLSGFEITSAGATAAGVVTPTVTGVLGGTLNYTLAVVAGATLQNPTLQVTFAPPLPSSAVNTAIAVNLPSLGAGSTNATVVAHGFQI